jgi:hypothetical protein
MQQETGKEKDIGVTNKKRGAQYYTKYMYNTQ